MEIYLMAIASFIACVYAYTLGAKHGMSVSNGRVPHPVKEIVTEVTNAVQTKKEPIEDLMQSVMSYDYETALQAVKNERLGGRT